MDTEFYNVIAIQR